MPAHVLHRPSQTRREDRGSLHHRELVASDLDRLAEPLAGLAKRERCDAADVIDGDHLQPRLGLDALQQPTLLDAGCLPAEVVHEEHRPQDRRGNVERGDPLFDLVLALEVREPGRLVGARNARVHEVVDAGLGDGLAPR